MPPEERPVAAGRRLDGWKAIAAHLGRDRTTVMRWHERHEMPVHRLPGATRAPVHAWTHELDRWLAGGGDRTEAIPAAAPAPVRQGQRRLIIAAFAGLLVLTGLGTAMALRQPEGRAPAAQPVASLPPADMERFLAARALWADRSAASLARARGELAALTAANPDFAPGWAALAESWLLSREFAALPDEQAFAEAERAARRAVALDPGSAAGHRALGFLAYWWRHRPVEAGKAFRRALALSPGDAQTHFWYGNVLSDNGRHDAALRHLARARTLDPGNVSLKVDHAWALWQAGEQARADRLHAELRASAPDHAVLRSSLADLAMIARDWPEFLTEYAAYARLRDDADLIREAGEARAAWASGGLDAMRPVLMRGALDDLKANPSSTRCWAAVVASSLGDRATLLALLEQAVQGGEAWGNSGYRQAILDHWPDDSRVAELIGKLAAPPAE